MNEGNKSEYFSGKEFTDAFIRSQKKKKSASLILYRIALLCLRL